MSNSPVESLTKAGIPEEEAVKFIHNISIAYGHYPQCAAEMFVLRLKSLSNECDIPSALKELKLRALPWWHWYCIKERLLNVFRKK